MPTTLKTKSIDELLAEADELVQKYNSEFLEELEEEHRLQFEKHAQRLQELKSEVQAKTEEKGTDRIFFHGRGNAPGRPGYCKAMKDLTSYFS